MFSNRFRWLKVLLLSTVLSALCFGNYRTVPAQIEQDLRERLSHPGEQTEPIQVGFASVLNVHDDTTARMLVWGKPMDVVHGGERWKQGDVVSFSGWITKQGGIHVTSSALHTGRWVKKLVSLAAALSFFVILGIHFFRGRTRKEGVCRT
jgi:hypothetical protein